jgi:chromosome segregation ATPase
MDMGGSKGSAGMVGAEKAKGKKRLALRIDTLAAAAEAMGRRVDGLRADIARLDATQSNLSDSAKRLGGRVATLERKGKTLEGALGELNRSVPALEERIGEAAGAAPADSLLVELKEQLGDLRQAVDGRLGSFTEHLQELESALQEAEARGRDLGRRLEGLEMDEAALTELDSDLAATRLEANQTLERLVGLESARDEDTALMALEDRIGGLEGLWEAANQRSADTVAKAESKLASLEQEVDGLLHRYGALAKDAERLAGASADMDETAAKMAEGLDQVRTLAARVATLEQQAAPTAQTQRQLQGTLTEFGERLGETRDRVENLSGQVQQDSRRLGSLGEQLNQDREALEALNRRTSEQDGRMDRLDEGLAALSRDKQTLLEDHARGLGEIKLQTSDIAERIAELGKGQGDLEREAGQTQHHLGVLQERIGACEEMAGAQDARIQDLGADVDQYRLDLSSVVTRLDELRDGSGRTDRLLEQTAARVTSLDEQGRGLQQSAEAAQKRTRSLSDGLKATSAAVEATKREGRSRDETLARLGGGVRRLGWAGLVVASLLLALASAAYLRLSHTQDLDREATADAFQSLEGRLVSLADPDPPRIGPLHEALGDLNQQFGELQSQVTALSSAEASRSEAGDAADRTRENLLQALDELSGRVARLETGAPSAAAAPAAAAPSVEEGIWNQAQRMRRYTLQLLGVRKRQSLAGFARRHELGADTAWWETRHQGKPWFVLFHGVYPSSQAAMQAVPRVQESVPGIEPWPRRIPDTGVIHSLQ